MAIRHTSQPLNDFALQRQVQAIRQALGNLVVAVDTDALLLPVAGEKQPETRPAVTEALPTLDPPLSATIIAARRDDQ